MMGSNRILILFGSARPNGNTYQALSQIWSSSMPDCLDVSQLHLTPYDYDHKNKEDSFLKTVEETILKYDILVIATPVYWYNMSTQMKIFFDRFSDLLHVRKDLGRALSGKKMYVMCTFSDPDKKPSGFEDAFIQTCQYLDMDYLGCSYLYFGPDEAARSRNIAEIEQIKNSLAVPPPRFRLYPDIEPYKTGFLQVDDVHHLYYEESGNPNGKPVVFLHGGPGSGTNAGHRRYFDPKHYRIVLFDQRGAGKSKPFACLQNNTTWDLVADMEKLRSHLDIEKWFVFGGSWGSTLALSYGILHSDRVLGLVLRGIFLCSQEDVNWFYQGGARFLFPDVHAPFVDLIPENERHDMISAYYKRLTGDDSLVRQAAAKAWAAWEGALLRLKYDPSLYQEFTADEKSMSLSTIECHYFFNRGFFEEDGWILKNVHRLRHVPAVIIHGRYDVVCPLKNAWDLHRSWPEAALKIVPDAGHAGSEVGISAELVMAMEKFKRI